MVIDIPEVVKIAPTLRERIIASEVTRKLRGFREQLEADMSPEPWTELHASAALFLADVCDGLGLSPEQRAEVLGDVGISAYVYEVATGPGLIADLNKRQRSALLLARSEGFVNLRLYRAMWPTLSDESLRLDLSDLCSRGLLTQSGSNRGTRYILPQKERSQK